MNEKDLSAADMLKFNDAKLKELRTVAYEKQAICILTPEESAWARAQHSGRTLTSMCALKWKSAKGPLGGHRAGGHGALGPTRVRGPGSP